ncbi:MAG TPA: hypothetical protein VKE70_32685 [Candidatus Solibacter sp.]|nr:hypothetical protein [Candidatus Solibacter sp.]
MLALRGVRIGRNLLDSHKIVYILVRVKTALGHFTTVSGLQRLVIKEDKYNKSITLPSYIRDVAKVQIWCAWAETLLGEASFDAPVK